MGIKNISLKNMVTILFAIFVLLGIFMSKDSPTNLMNAVIQGFPGYSILALSLLIPIMAGMGFNFAIGIGAMAGQLGMILAMNFGLSGISSFLVAVFMGSFFALLFGLPTGIIMNKARGYEMITSWFMVYVGTGINQFILLYLVGTVIPLSSALMMLEKGSGLKSTINLEGTLLNSVDGLLQMSFFFLLMVFSLLYLAWNVYGLMQKEAHYDKSKSYHRIIISFIIALISGMIMYGNLFPEEINQLKTVKFPLITGLLVCAVVAFIYFIKQTKLGKDLDLTAATTQNTSTTERQLSKVRITAIVISTVLAAWGQIVLLQSTGLFSTYSPLNGVGLSAMFALIVGGASLKTAKIHHALLGVFLIQCFHIISMPVISEGFLGNGTEIFRVLLMNSAVIYTFVKAGSIKQTQSL